MFKLNARKTFIDIMKENMGIQTKNIPEKICDKRKLDKME